ncbi:DUF4142 domain-containing protein [Pseudomonas sp. SWRI81]|uniref:DUF4142 domain-containing protein n=1 Tax=Pseudomonas sp. SWRI81 TaxID=2745505 RepID=UPI001645289C|nr:DUF4142 domain-containing protein [Pseudomonas sp. SWRI81]MBC3271235.1 DUF4142 domain-containing protein [Pseudomonas sp. SWRI81]
MKTLATTCLAALLLSLQTVTLCYAVTLNAFVEEAAEQSLFQNDSARIALEKSALPDVRDFARQMIADHDRVYPQLQKLGQALRMDVPAQPSVASKAKRLRLESRDESFDRVYIDSQAQTLERKLMLFKKEAMSSENPQLKAFASTELPGIEKQAQKAKDLQEQLKPSAGALKSTKP